ncbi:CLAVATA3/ESR (CLE)-related protein 33-like [Mangifera indica]|uniref:CLAVATA3/ESR (CLE)-related protein 33-like n=1 Tax=Mangifera indica TaxID=29780 RepID=UPI001CFA9482|nr:CLAVATA3/ESR (CLE)-related protein 33-like [Mangifera indica]
MAFSFRFLLCLFLLSDVALISQTRPLDNDATLSGSLEEVSRMSLQKQKIIERHFESKQFSNDKSRALMENAREMLKESVKRQEILGRFFDSKRRSPGGPDPHHH